MVRRKKGDKDDDPVERCSPCKGTGHVYVRQMVEKLVWDKKLKQDVMGFVRARVERTCANCNGVGIVRKG